MKTITKTSMTTITKTTKKLSTPNFLFSRKVFSFLHFLTFSNETEQDWQIRHSNANFHRINEEYQLEEKRNLFLLPTRYLLNY
jgi:hypothetical protein